MHIGPRDASGGRRILTKDCPILPSAAKSGKGRRDARGNAPALHYADRAWSAVIGDEGGVHG